MDALPSVDEDFPDQQAPSKPLQGVSPYAIGIQKYWEGQNKLPTVDDDFGPTAPPSWATRADAAMQNSIFRIQNAFGTGAKAGFGEAPLETFTNVFSKESVDAAKKAGWWNDYAKGEADIYKSMLEGGMRGAAVVLAIGQRAAVGLLSGAAEAVGQTGEELGLAAPRTLTGEYGLRGAVTDPGVMMALAPFGTQGEAEAFKAADTAAAQAVLEREMAAEKAAAPPFGKRVTPQEAPTIPQAAEETQNVFLRPQPEEEPRTLQELPSATAPIALPIGEEGQLSLRAASLKAQDLQLAQQQRGLARGGQPAVDKLAQLSAVERNLADESLTAEQRKVLQRRRDELLTDTTPEKLKAEAAPIEQRRAIQAQRDNIAQQLQDIGEKQAKSRLSQVLRNAANLHIDLDTARAHGVLAEGEAGYYDLRPPTPESTQARTAAAKSAGISTPTPEPPPRNIEELARRIAPKEFQRADEITMQRAEHARELVRLSETSPEVVAEQSKISSLLDKVNGVQEKLPEAEQRELQDAQARLEAAQRKETPEMAAVREKIRALDTEASALTGDISEAHRQAEDLMPDQKTIDELVKAQRAEPAMLAQPEVSSYPAKANLSVVSGVAQEEELARTVGEARVAAGQAMRARQEHPEAAEFQKQIDAQLNAPEAAPAAEPTAAPKTRTTTSIRPVEGTGEAQTRTLAQGVEDKAVASKLTDSFGDLPEYEQVSMADQAARANQLIADDYETAKAVALGTKQPPRNVLPESVFVAVEKRAIADGDVDTLRQLAIESKLTTAATTMGQRIRTLKERDPTSPVGAIQEIQRAREAARADIGAAKQAAVDEIKAAVRRNATSKPAWSAFIDSIMCAEE